MPEKTPRSSRALMATARLLAHAADKLNRKRSIFSSLFSVVMELAGFSFFTYAGFQVSSVIGSAVAGVSCLVLAAHFGSGDDAETRGTA